MEKTYSQADKLMKDAVLKGNSKTDLKASLEAAKSQCNDERFIKWCDKKIEELK